MKNIAAAFIKAKRAFGPVLKDKSNPAFRGSKYAPLEACLEAVDDACLSNGIALYQETSEDPTGVTVETVFLHESGESLRCGKLHVPASKQDPQGYGSALTYARRYSLLAACGIAAEDDDGNAASQRRPQVERQEAANDPARTEWLLSRKSEIAAAKNVGELKKIVAEAVLVAATHGDTDAVDQINAAAEAKMSAKKVQA